MKKFLGLLLGILLVISASVVAMPCEVDSGIDLTENDRIALVEKKSDELIVRLQGHVNLVIAHIYDIIADVLLEYPIFLECRKYRNEAYRLSRNLVKNLREELNKNLGNASISPEQCAQMRKKFSDKLYDTLMEGDKKVKSIFGVAKPGIYFFYA